MIFINSVVQIAFLNILCTRRGKRSKYGAVTHNQIRQKANFDRYIIMISSHHPHIWSYGTGNLLVAPTTPETLTKAAESANEWRSESLKEHDIDGILDEGFDISFDTLLNVANDCPYLDAFLVQYVAWLLSSDMVSGT